MIKRLFYFKTITLLYSIYVYSYAVAGLSPEKLRVLLHPIPNHQFSFDGLASNREQDHGADVVLWETRDSTGGQWKTAEVVYTCRHPHQVSEASKKRVLVDSFYL